MNNNMKKQYEAPELVVVEFAVESGYALSNQGVMSLGFFNNDDEYEVEGNEASTFESSHWQW